MREITDAFYLIQDPKTGWFWLCVTENHFCISAGYDLQTRLNTLRRWVVKYRTEHNVLQALRNFEMGGTVSSSAQKDRSTRFEADDAKYFVGMVRREIKDALKDAIDKEKKNTPIQQFLRKKQKSVTITPTPTVTRDSVKPSSAFIVPRVLVKPR